MTNNFLTQSSQRKTDQVIIIVLLIISFLTIAFPAYSQDMPLTELQTKALILNKKGQYSEAVKVAEEALKVTEEEFWVCFIFHKANTQMPSLSTCRH